MKKLFAVLLALCMLFSVALAEAAEEAPAVIELNWADVEEAAAQIEGRFVAIGDLGVMIYVPNAFSELEVPQEYQDAGVIAVLSTEDGAAAISIAYRSLGEMTSDEFFTQLQESGAENFELAMINGEEALSYDVTYQGVKTSNVVFANEEDMTILTFSFAPMDDEGFAAVAALMVPSIQPAVEQ